MIVNEFTTMIVNEFTTMIVNKFIQMFCEYSYRRILF
jgi:hypothetical protein